jgi:Na+-transporting methylmalonyl-CoA/oxaloacetate decarboxylase gamma subunit
MRRMFDIILENACVFAFYFGLAYFIGIIASDATDGMIKQTIEEKKACNKAVSNRALKIAVVVAIISTYMNIVTTNRVNNQIKDAQKEGIELVRENPTEYLDSDVFQQYIAEHIDDIKLDYDLFSYDDFE